MFAGVDEEPHRHRPQREERVADLERAHASEPVGDAAAPEREDEPAERRERRREQHRRAVHAEHRHGVRGEERDEQVAGRVVADEDDGGEDDRLRVVAEELAERRGRLLLAALQVLEDRALLDRAADDVADADQHDGQQERDAPAPRQELVGREQRGDHEQRRRREDHADGHADLREGAEEAAARGRCVLHGHERRATPLATGREPLQDAEQDQQDRSGDADRGIRREQADECGGQAHQDQREHEHLLAAEPVAEVAGHDRAERSEEERDADGREREHLGEPGARLGDGCEEERCEHEAGGLRVDEEVVPLDRGADERAGEDLALLRGHPPGGAACRGQLTSCELRCSGVSQ